MPIQNRAQQLQIYEISSLSLPHSNLLTEYKITYKYIGVTYDETKAVTTSDLQYKAGQHANGQLCRINAPFQPLANLPSCVTALHAKNNQTIKEQCSLVISHMHHTCVPIAVCLNLWIIFSNPQTLGSRVTIICPDKATSTVSLQQPFHILRLSPASSATSNYFHLTHITRITLW